MIIVADDIRSQGNVPGLEGGESSGIATVTMETLRLGILFISR